MFVVLALLLVVGLAVPEFACVTLHVTNTPSRTTEAYGSCFIANNCTIAVDVQIFSFAAAGPGELVVKWVTLPGCVNNTTTNNVATIFTVFGGAVDPSQCGVLSVSKSSK